MLRFFILAISVINCMVFSTISLAKSNSNKNRIEKVLKVNPVHVDTWRRFVDALLSIHKENLKNRQIITQQKTGGYSSLPKFYNEITYIDTSNNTVLSRLQWEVENPLNLHLIEVFIHNKEGQVIEDYAAAFLPHHRNAPVQTLINIHTYNDELHAYRQFDASGNYIYEQCQGKLAEKSVFLSIEEDDLFTPNGSRPAFMNSVEYQSCFSTLDVRIEDYLEWVFSNQRLANKPEPSTRFD